MSFDFGACKRRTRSARSATALPPRPDEALVFVDDLPRAGARLLLDTCVYIDGLKGKTPPALDALIEARAVYHSAVALAELAFSFGRLDPGDPRTPGALAAAEALILSIPGHRLLNPGPGDWTEGAIRAGVAARLLALDDATRRKVFHDAVLAAQAARTGASFVTRDIADFDRLSQLDDRLHVVFYRAA